jgi:hypothetical protein
LGAALATAGLLATSSSAIAAPFECSGTASGSYDSVTVPDDGSCVLDGATVAGRVTVGNNAYFESDGSSIGGNVRGENALTLFVHSGSSVGGNVWGQQAAQVFLFDSEVGGSVLAQDSVVDFGRVHVCGMEVGANVRVRGKGTDILIGEPAADCGGNTIGGNLRVLRNQTDIELVIRANTIGGDMKVNRNEGPSDKLVDNNTGTSTLICRQNESPFTGGPNPGWATIVGQCS